MLKMNEKMREAGITEEYLQQFESTVKEQVKSHYSIVDSMRTAYEYVETVTVDGKDIDFYYNGADEVVPGGALYAITVSPDTVIVDSNYMALSEEQRAWIKWHEVGHVMCGHMEFDTILNRSLAQIIDDADEFFYDTTRLECQADKYAVDHIKNGVQGIAIGLINICNATEQRYGHNDSLTQMIIIRLYSLGFSYEEAEIMVKECCCA